MQGLRRRGMKELQELAIVPCNTLAINNNGNTLRDQLDDYLDYNYTNDI